jgi:hypothetical protein
MTVADHWERDKSCRPGPDNTGLAWIVRAPELATWAWSRLVNRDDAFGGYYQVCNNQGTWVTQQTTRPKKADRGKVLLDQGVLLRHFRATTTRDVVGLHTTSPENTSRWGALDIDKHEGGTASLVTNLGAALAWYDRLRLLGFAPLLSASNGKGGYHLLAIFNRAVSTMRVFALLQWLTADYARHGLTARPETFPKQPAILPGRYGNWLRLPGRHHTRPHWSKVWSGSRWLEGAEAVAFILQLQGSPPDLIPFDDLVLPTAPGREDARHLPPLTTYDQAGHLGHRIQGRLNRLPNLAAGQCRHGVAYTFGSWLARDLNLPDEVAMAWLLRWDSRNTPPLGEGELREILTCARQYGQHAYGCGLSSPSPVRSGGKRRHAHGAIHFTVRF